MKSLWFLLSCLAVGPLMAVSSFAQLNGTPTVSVGVTVYAEKSPLVGYAGGTIALTLRNPKTGGIVAGKSCPECATHPDSCRCNAVLTWKNLPAGKYVVAVEVQDKRYQDSNGKVGRHKVLGYYAGTTEGPGLSEAITDLKRATRLLIDKTHLSHNVTFAIRIGM